MMAWDLGTRFKAKNDAQTPGGVRAPGIPCSCGGAKSVRTSRIAIANSIAPRLPTLAAL